MHLPVSHRTKFELLLLFLIVSIASSRALPFLQPWGADLHNLVVYHRCAVDRSHYLIDAKTCGDLFGNEMLYPPLLYHSFYWLKPLTLGTAMCIWAPLTWVALAFVMYTWSRLGSRATSATNLWQERLFALLLLFQYPVAFSLERGGTDIVPLALFTLGAVLFQKGRHAFAGIAFGVATAYKLYPVFATLVVVLGLFWCWVDQRARGSRAWLACGAAALGAFVLTNLVFFDDAMLYYRQVLPEFSQARIAPVVYAHSLPSFVGAGYPGFARALGAALIALWVFAARRAFASANAPLALAGALAITTYLPGTSWDYNLVTTYPLLMLVFQRAQETDRWGLLLLGLVGIVGERELFATQGALLNPTTHVALQVAFLTLVAIDLGWPVTRPERAQGGQVLGQGPEIAAEAE